VHRDALAGCCGLKPRWPRVHEFGFYLVPAAQGRGLALEAGRAVIAYAFDVLGVDALFAGHHPDNHASKKALGRLGFVPTAPELYPPTGLVHPGYELTNTPSTNASAR
jgi:RimJ/RimL family protein N-acetyltransferase